MLALDIALKPKLLFESHRESGSPTAWLALQRRFCSGLPAPGSLLVTSAQTQRAQATSQTPVQIVTASEAPTQQSELQKGI